MKASSNGKIEQAKQFKIQNKTEQKIRQKKEVGKQLN